MFWAGCYCYLTDVTTEKNRTKRFAYLDGLWPIGYFTGMFFAGMIKEDLGYMYNYALGILTRYFLRLYIFGLLIRFCQIAVHHRFDSLSYPTTNCYKF